MIGLSFHVFFSVHRGGFVCISCLMEDHTASVCGLELHSRVSTASETTTAGIRF